MFRHSTLFALVLAAAASASPLATPAVEAGVYTTVHTGNHGNLPALLPPGAVPDVALPEPNAVVPLSSPDPGVCYQACLKDALCVQWTYLPSSPNAFCYMRDVSPWPTIARPGAVTGTIHRLTPDFSKVNKFH